MKLAFWSEEAKGRKKVVIDRKISRQSILEEGTTYVGPQEWKEFGIFEKLKGPCPWNPRRERTGRGGVGGNPWPQGTQGSGHIVDWGLGDGAWILV